MSQQSALPKDYDFSISKASRANIRYVCDSHYHDVYEIYYLVSGTRRQFVDHKIYDIKRGDLILIPGRVIHKTTAIDKNQHVRYLISFSEDYVRPLLADLPENTLQQIFSSVHIPVPESRRGYVLGLFDKISEEYNAAAVDAFSERMLKNYLSELFVFILRYNRKNPVGERAERIPEEKIQTAAKYIYENYQQELTLSKVAAHVYMSDTYFSKKFKKVTGLSFREYLTSVRIKMADEMLLETKQSIAQIAEACGFADANYFGDVFKKAKGVSPLQYRKFKTKL